MKENISNLYFQLNVGYQIFIFVKYLIKILHIVSAFADEKHETGQFDRSGFQENL